MSAPPTPPIPKDTNVAINGKGALALAIMLLDRLGAAIADPATPEARQTLEYVRRFLPILRDIAGLAELSPDAQADVWNTLSAIAMKISEAAS